MKILLILTQALKFIKTSKKDIIISTGIIILIIVTSGLFTRQVNIAYNFRKDLSGLEKNKNLNVILNTLAKELPVSEDISPLMGGLATLAKKCQLKDISITPSPVIEGEIYNEIPMEMTAQATYHDLAVFLNKVEKLDTLVNISGLRLENPGPEESTLLRVQIRACTYTLNKGTFVK